MWSKGNVPQIQSKGTKKDEKKRYIEQLGRTTPMTSASISCPKQSNRRVTTVKKVRLCSCIPSLRGTEMCVFLKQIQYEGSHFYFLQSFLSFISQCAQSMSSASTTVIPFRDGIHDTGLIHMHARQQLGARTQNCTDCTHTTTSTCTGQPGEEGWVVD